MPIYEFFCPQTNKIYSFYARSISMAGQIPRCPDNPKFRMERMISSFSVTGKKQEEKGPPTGADPEFPRMEKAMAEMERDFAGMDEENPDPRQLARMMRKMSDLTGEKMPQTMQEMITRMEKGEDPEKLEEEYGDALEDFDPGGAPGAESAEDAKEARKLRWRKEMQRRVVRDPVLYEMGEWVGGEGGGAAREVKGQTSARPPTVPRDSRSAPSEVGRRKERSSAKRAKSDVGGRKSVVGTTERRKVGGRKAKGSAKRGRGKAVGGRRRKVKSKK